MGKARDISKLFSSSVSNITLNDYVTTSTASSVYLSKSSASSTYATQASLSNIDSDNLPDIHIMMGG